MELEKVIDGVWKVPGARIVDRPGRRRLAIGYSDFVAASAAGALVDKTMLVADVIDSHHAATLFCRPRRFGKTLNITMLKAFFEASDANGLSPERAEALFAGTDIWEAADGGYRAYQGAYPVVHVSFSTAKKLTWKDSLAEIRGLVAEEYLRHRYLREGNTPLSPEDVAYFDAIAGNRASDADFARSLAVLCRMLRDYHGRGVVVLVDEYDAPVMAGYTNGYYDYVVSFLKGWLTGALKDGGTSLAFACLTGVQRISKESVFSDLNNLYVSTPLGDEFDERYGFSDAETRALSEYLGYADCSAEAQDWYDGYRFGEQDVYNPWSIVNYLSRGCRPGVYWGNTSGNTVVGELVSSADADTLGNVYDLLEPGGTVCEPLDLGVVFPELGADGGALWSMLYLAGYLTTDDVADPSDELRLRPLRVPNKEVRRLFRTEVVRRFRSQAGGTRRLTELHDALVRGRERALESELSRITERASSFDLTGELSCHMLLMGLLFGVPGYEDPISNREAGYGRYDIRLEPSLGVNRPLITIELKYLRPDAAPRDVEALMLRVQALAEEALVQIAERGYDAHPPQGVTKLVRWGVAFCGKRVAARAEVKSAPGE